MSSEISSAYMQQTNALHTAQTRQPQSDKGIQSCVYAAPVTSQQGYAVRFSLLQT